MGYRVATLGELSLDNGKYGIAASAVDFDTELPAYLRITDINDDGTLNKLDRKSVNDPSACKYMLSEGDIVFARTGNSTGRNYFYDPRDGKFAFAGFLVKFSLDASKVNPRFVKYYAQSRAYWDWVASFKTGSTRGNINAKTYAQMPIPLPERSAQNSIVALCDCISDKIRINAQLNGYLEELCDALFLDFLEQADSSWHEGTLEELAEVKYGKDHKKLADGPYPVYGSGGFMRSAEKSLFSGESVLIPRKGSLNNVMYVNEAFWTVDTMFFTVPRIPGAAKFLYQYVKRLDLASMNSGSAVPSMTTSILNALSLPVPPRDSLLSFNAKLQSMYDAVRANNLENRRLESLRDSLLPKLMTGEIDVSKIDLTQLNSHLVERRHSPLQLQDCK